MEMAMLRKVIPRPWTAAGNVHNQPPTDLPDVHGK